MKSEPRRQKKTHPNQSYHRAQIPPLFVFLPARVCGVDLGQALVHCIGSSNPALNNTGLAWSYRPGWSRMSTVPASLRDVLCMYVHTLGLGLRGSLHVVSDGS